MKIKFTVYWFENDLAWANSNQEAIEDLKNFLAMNLGFCPNIQFYFDENPSLSHTYLKNNEQFSFIKIDGYDETSLLRANIDFNQADLVLMDYHLSGEATGDRVISYIRDNQHDFFTEVLFYSANETQSNLRRLVDRDGLYCSERDDVFIKIKKVVRTIVKKIQDINAIRGLVMAETAEIDALMKEILLKIISKFMLTHRKRAACYSCHRGLKSVFSSPRTGQIFEIDGYEKNLSVYVHNLKTSQLYNAIRTFLGHSINDTGLQASVLSEYKTYQEAVCRNILAHHPASHSTINNTITINIPNKRSEIFDEVRFIEIRKNIQTYKNKFIQIKDSL